MKKMLHMILPMLLLLPGVAPGHEEHHRQRAQQDPDLSGRVVYVKPSYPFTTHYIKPHQDPRRLHMGSDGRLHEPRKHRHHRHPIRRHHHPHAHYYDETVRDPRYRLVQNGFRLQLLDENNRSIRHIYLHAGASWEQPYGYVVVSSSTKLRVFDAELRHLNEMHLPPDASFSFHADGIELRTRFHNEFYDYHLRRLHRERAG